MGSGPAKRLLLVAYNFPPDYTVGAKRALRIATHLTDLGWDVSVVTVRSAFYDRLDPTLMSSPPPFRIIRSSTLAPVVWGRRLRRAWRRVRPGQSAPAFGGPAAPDGASPRGGAWRAAIAIPDDYSGWIPPAVLAGWLRVRRPDVVLATGPPFTAHIVAAVLARLRGSRLVLDYRDPWSRRDAGTGEQAGASDETAARLERWTTRQAAALTATTHGLVEVLSAWPGPRRQMIPNAVDTLAAGAVHLEPPSNPRFTILYAGTFYQSRSARPVLQALARLKSNGSRPPRGITLLVMGVASDEVLREAERLDVRAWVEVLDFQPYAEAMRRMQAADLLLLVVGDTHGGLIPAKLFDYLAVRRPILGIGPRGSEAEGILREAGAGEMLLSDDVAGIAARIAAHASAAGPVSLPAVPERLEARATMSELDRFLRGLVA